MAASPCRHFVRPGGCKLGSECRFLHTHNPQRHVGAKSAVPCRHMMTRGFCAMGNKCQFAHSTAGAAPAAAAAYPGAYPVAYGSAPYAGAEAPAAAYPPLDYSAAWAQYYAETAGHPREAHPALLPSPAYAAAPPALVPEGAARSPCRHYNKPGGCTRGKRCQFAHVFDSVLASYHGMNEADVWRANLPFARVRPGECAYFLTPARCHLGDTCSFKHDAEHRARVMLEAGLPPDYTEVRPRPDGEKAGGGVKREYDAGASSAKRPALDVGQTVAQ